MDQQITLRCQALMTCPVCFEGYSFLYPPVTLMCGHTICKLCVREIEVKDDYMKCPIDKKRKKMRHKITVNEDYLQLVEKLRAGEFPKRESKPSVGVSNDSIDPHRTIKRKIYRIRKAIKKSRKVNRMLEETLSFTFSIFYH